MRALLLAFLCLSSGIAAARATLYVRLGGESGVAAIANSLIDRTAADPVAGRSFEGSNLKRIKRLLAEQLCAMSGGPCRYTGDSMREVHAGLHISEAEFYRMVDILRGILHERDIDQRSENELLAMLAPMKRDVVEHARAARAADAPVDTLIENPGTRP